MDTDDRVIELPAPRDPSDARSHHHRMLLLVFCNSEGESSAKTHVRGPCGCGWPGIAATASTGTQFHKDAYATHVLGDLRG